VIFKDTSFETASVPGLFSFLFNWYIICVQLMKAFKLDT